MKLQRREKKSVLVSSSHLKLQKLWPQCVTCVWPQCLVKMETVLICIISYFERETGHIHIIFPTVYCYKCSILLLVTAVILTVARN